jgi:hypothetical protein
MTMNLSRQIVARLVAVALIAAAPALSHVFVVPSDVSPTIPQAMLKAREGDTVLVKRGVYKGNVSVERGVALVAESPFETVIEGKGRQTVVTLNGNSVVSGFEIRNGSVGVLSKGVDNAITRCRIVRNWETGIVCVGHLPRIEDNVIAYNRASGIQGYRVRATVFPAIVHNTIAYNSNHGISIGGLSDIGIDANIIAFNERFGVKTESGESMVKLNGNDVFGNALAGTGNSPGEVQADPAFVSARTLDFRLGEGSACSAQGELQEDLGARFHPMPQTVK